LLDNRLADTKEFIGKIRPAKPRMPQEVFWKDIRLWQPNDEGPLCNCGKTPVTPGGLTKGMTFSAPEINAL